VSLIVRLTISNKLPEIRLAAAMVDQFCQRHGLPGREANAINVVLDEILSNVIHHGLDHSARHEISIALNLDAGEITMEVEDDGAPFDPTGVPAPVLADNLSERKIGGLGLVFVRALTDSIAYRRVANRNRLVLRRRVKDGVGAAQPSPAFRISESTQGTGLVLAVEGRIDSEAAKTLRDRLFNAIRASPGRVAVDLSRVSYVGSAGIWALLAAEYRATARGGGLVIFGLSREMGKLLGRTGVAGALRICETAQQALATLHPAAPPR